MLWFHCDSASGEIITGGVASSESDAYLQAAPEGLQLFVLPNGSVGSPFAEEPDFSALKHHLQQRIDVEAGAIRARYITDVPGQAQTYERKEREARAWTEGANEADFPFLATEASVRGIDIADVRAEVIAQVNALTPLAALVEAHRMGAKAGVQAATTLPAIVSAGVVDWDNVLGG